MAELNRNTLVARAQNLLETEDNGELVMLSIDKGVFYGLNKPGTRIWSLLTEPKRVSEILSVLLHEYDVDAATCEQQVLELLEELRSEGIVDLHDGPAVDGP